MPIFRRGNMLETICASDNYYFLANNVVTKAGELVMGVGAALTFKCCFPGCRRLSSSAWVNLGAYKTVASSGAALPRSRRA